MPNRIEVRQATTHDVAHIAALIEPYVAANVLLRKDLVQLYEDVQEFVVAADAAGRVVGCGALHVMWRDLGEIRTILTSDEVRGQGVGHLILENLMDRARTLRLERLFCLTFETRFFERHGFVAVGEQVVDQPTRQHMLRSTDAGVHEFLELPWVKPNTLGNTRMICVLAGSSNTDASELAEPPSASPAPTEHVTDTDR